MHTEKLRTLHTSAATPETTKVRAVLRWLETWPFDRDFTAHDVLMALQPEVGVMDQQPVTIVIQSDPWQVFKVFACCIAVYLYGKHAQREESKKKTPSPQPEKTEE